MRFAVGHALDVVPRLVAGGPAFSPLDLGAKLKLWLPYSGANRFQDTARTTPCTTAVPGTTDLVASWADISGSGKHATQATSGARPKYRAAGGVQFTGGNTWMQCAAIGAWAGDFDVFIAAKVTTYNASARLLDMGSVSGYIVGAANNVVAPNLLNSIVADTVPTPYGLEVPCTDGVLHRIVDSRIGTTHNLTIDGSLAGTETVSGAALPDSIVYVCTATGVVGSYCLIGDEYEVIIAAGLTAGERSQMAAWLTAQTYV